MQHDEESPSRLPCACTTLRKATRVVSRLYDDALAECGVTATQLAILRSLDRTGPAPLSRLAETMVMDRTTLYRALAPLAATGWVAVAPPVRGRSKVAELTAAGRSAMGRAASGWEAAQHRFISEFGAEKWMALHAVLTDVIALSSL